LICTNLYGDPNIGLLPLYGCQFACGAEIMRSYTNWQASDFARFQGWMTNLWYPLCNGFSRATMAPAYLHLGELGFVQHGLHDCHRGIVRQPNHLQPGDQLLQIRRGQWRGQSGGLLPAQLLLPRKTPMNA
jgi:hypothetical protein